MSNIFKDKNDKEGNNITDKLITKISQLLRLVTIITGHIAKETVRQAQANHK